MGNQLEYADIRGFLRIFATELLFYILYLAPSLFLYTIIMLINIETNT